MKRKINKLQLLRERVDRNYADYKAQILTLESEYVFELAAEIAAIRDTYFWIMACDWIDDEIAVFLLNFVNPLKLLAEGWREFVINEGVDFDEFVDDFVVYGDASDYMTVDIEYELREKYGLDIPLDTACLLEIIDLGKLIVSGIEDCGFCCTPDDDSGCDIDFDFDDDFYKKDNEGDGA